MYIINIAFWNSLMIFIDDTSWEKIVCDVKALNYGYLKTNVFAGAKMFAVSNKMKQPIITRVIF